jgi:16S rRNA (guanine527-N7)-methyltransferase
MQLTETERFAQAGLDDRALERLSMLGDLLLGAEINVTSVREPLAVERQHFLDSLTLLTLSAVRQATALVDVGSGGGLPALVLAIALPGLHVVALESVGKKCVFIERTAAELELSNVAVVCARAEEHGRAAGRARYDVAVARAVATLPVLAELCVPLVRCGGSFVAMKSAVSDQERIHGDRALAILGAGCLASHAVDPFPGGDRRWLYVAAKTGDTPEPYPRRVGVPGRKPLGGISTGE